MAFAAVLCCAVLSCKAERICQFLDAVSVTDMFKKYFSYSRWLLLCYNSVDSMVAELVIQNMPVARYTFGGFHFHAWCK